MLTRRRRWKGQQLKWPSMLGLAAAWLVVGMFVLVVTVAVLSWFLGGDSGFLGSKDICDANAVGCNAAIEFLGTLSVVALAFGYFTSWRINRIARHHLRDARDKPWKLVPTATKIDKVVGRTGLCEILERDLVQKKQERQKEKRGRPQVIVAGVGDGKTAVLVRLTQFLNDAGAVPVPIRLADARDHLDFVDLGRQRFVERIEALSTEEEGNKVWRELREQRRIVVLADGLEEALPSKTGAERENAVRLAIEKADEVNVPLVIATRPDPVLESLDVAIIRLEPLPAKSVVNYICEAKKDAETRANGNAAPEMSDDRIKRLVRTAQMFERPLYLKLARELYVTNRLDRIVDSRGRMAARFELLNAWRETLVEQDGIGMRQSQRKRGLSAAEQMACVSMKDNNLEIELKTLPASRYWELDGVPRALAGLAEKLDLVEVISERVRFHHGVMQAFLGACRLGGLYEEPVSDGDSPPAEAYVAEAMEDPGREFLMALVMYCVARNHRDNARSLRSRLCHAAENSSSRTSFELLAAAHEIDSVAFKDVVDPDLDVVTREVWHREQGRAPGLETTEAKLRAILPMAENKAYGSLWDVCRAEDAYVVRFQAAQALADGGDSAFDAILKDVGSTAVRPVPDLAYTGEVSPVADSEQVRLHSLLGWTLPLLAATSERHEGAARSAITAYVRLAQANGAERPGLHLGVEAAFAQGLKWEANRIPVRADPELRSFLIERAFQLLEASQWWYTRIALLQALALWEKDPRAPNQGEIRARLYEHQRPAHHPLVAEVARLCCATFGANASESVRRVGRPFRRLYPSRFIWIDEVGVANKIGSRGVPPDEEATRRAELQIPPAAGWHALAPRARQVVAEILTFLNLIEGRTLPADASVREKDDRVRQREERRAMVYNQNPKKLPACLTGAPARDRLRVDQHATPTTNGNAADGPCSGKCRFGLCPYPARTAQPFRGELPETFCREQACLIRSRKLPPWDTAAFSLNIPRKRQARTKLEEFWIAMEERGQD